MQITITNGTLTQIQETLSAASGYVLPDSITVTGATSSYDSSTGVITLTSLTDTMSITAEGEQADNKITFGNLSINAIYCGNQKVVKISLGSVDIYTDEEQAVPANITSFIFNDRTYTAEDGMTWGEYINSSYNAGFSLVNNSVWYTPQNEIAYAVYSGMNQITASDAITANAVFIGIHSGGSND